MRRRGLRLATVAVLAVVAGWLKWVNLSDVTAPVCSRVPMHLSAAQRHLIGPWCLRQHPDLAALKSLDDGERDVLVVQTTADVLPGTDPAQRRGYAEQVCAAWAADADYDHQVRRLESGGLSGPAAARLVTVALMVRCPEAIS